MKSVLFVGCALVFLRGSFQQSFSIGWTHRHLAFIRNQVNVSQKYDRLQFECVAGSYSNVIQVNLLTSNAGFSRGRVPSDATSDVLAGGECLTGIKLRIFIPTIAAITTAVPTCQFPRSPKNGYIRSIDGIQVGDGLTFRCNDGYVPTSIESSECTSNGVWNPIPHQHTCTRTILVVDDGIQEEASRRNKVITIVTVGGFMLLLIGALTSVYTALGALYIICQKKSKVPDEFIKRRSRTERSKLAEKRVMSLESLTSLSRIIHEGKIITAFGKEGIRRGMSLDRLSHSRSATRVASHDVGALIKNTSLILTKHGSLSNLSSIKKSDSATSHKFAALIKVGEAVKIQPLSASTSRTAEDRDKEILSRKRKSGRIMMAGGDEGGDKTSASQAQASSSHSVDKKSKERWQKSSREVDDKDRDENMAGGDEGGDKTSAPQAQASSSHSVDKKSKERRRKSSQEVDDKDRDEKMAGGDESDDKTYALQAQVGRVKIVTKPDSNEKRFSHKGDASSSHSDDNKSKEILSRQRNSSREVDDKDRDKKMAGGDEGGDKTGALRAQAKPVSKPDSGEKRFSHKRDASSSHSVDSKSKEIRSRQRKSSRKVDDRDRDEKMCTQQISATAFHDTDEKYVGHNKGGAPTSHLVDDKKKDILSKKRKSSRIMMDVDAKNSNENTGEKCVGQNKDDALASHAVDEKKEILSRKRKSSRIMMEVSEKDSDETRTQQMKLGQVESATTASHTFDDKNKDTSRRRKSSRRMMEVSEKQSDETISQQISSDTAHRYTLPQASPRGSETGKPSLQEARKEKHARTSSSIKPVAATGQTTPDPDYSGSTRRSDAKAEPVPIQRRHIRTSSSAKTAGSIPIDSDKRGEGGDEFPKEEQVSSRRSGHRAKSEATSRSKPPR